MPSALKAAKPRVLVVPKPSMYRYLFNEEADRALRAAASVEFNDEERDFTSANLADRIASYDAIISGWLSPKFTDEVFVNAERLKLVAHSAGSVKFMFDEAALDRAIERDIAITTVAPTMAPAVAEMNLLLVLMCLRGVHRLDARMKSGEPWLPVKRTGGGIELAGQRVGVIGAGHVGRAFIRLLRALEVEVCVFDPYLSDAQAQELGVGKAAALDDLLTGCPVVCLHAPATPETRHMIGRRELSLLRDGAVFINTARSWCVDEAAMIEEFKSGRICGAVDVFDDEPLPPDSPLRKLDNVIVTPHIAAATVDCRYRQGRMAVEEIERFAQGKPPRYPVTRQQYAMMA